MKKSLKKDPSDYTEHRKRLKAKYLESGLSGFADHEVLELLLTYAVARKDMKPTAKGLLKEFKTLSDVMSADPEVLSQVDGVGEHSAILLSLVHAAAERFLKQESKKRFSLSSPQALYDYCRISLGKQKREQFRAYYLNSKNKLVAEEILQEGTVDQTVVYPRTVLEQALKHKAMGVLFAHNHPSGNLTPSSHDLKLTRLLIKTTATLGIKVHDHLIVTEDGYLSFHEKGLL